MVICPIPSHRSYVMSALVFALLISGCSSSTVTTRVTITERPDSLVIKGDSIAFQAKSDSIRIDSVEHPDVGRASLPDHIGSPSIAPLSPRPAFHSIHAKKDTTVGRWTLSFAYDYPPDRWGVKIIEADTTARWKVRDSIVERPYEVEVIPWWAKAVIGMLGVALILSLVKR